MRPTNILLISLVYDFYEIITVYIAIDIVHENKHYGKHILITELTH